jgi:hypothetical protein
LDRELDDCRLKLNEALVEDGNRQAAGGGKREGLGGSRMKKDSWVWRVECERARVEGEGWEGECTKCQAFGPDAGRVTRRD